MRVWCWPGNTNDNTVIPQVKDDLCGWRLGRVVTVVDRGFSSDENLAYLRRAGGHFIAGERMRDGSPPTPPPRWPVPGATSRCATTCASRRSPSRAPRASGGSCATTPTRP